MRISSLIISGPEETNEQDVFNFSNFEIINRIIALNNGLYEFWTSSKGWAPINAANLLSKSRLDWQVSLSMQLNIFLEPKIQSESGGLILAWVTLGSITEGTMKLFLSVWYEQYKRNIESSILRKRFYCKDQIIQSDELMLNKLIHFFSEFVYPKDIRKQWKTNNKLDLVVWAKKIQQRRNAIHSFKTREIGNFDDFFKEMKNYLIFLRRLTNTFPYPEYFYKPSETF